MRHLLKLGLLASLSLSGCAHMGSQERDAIKIDSYVETDWSKRTLSISAEDDNASLSSFWTNFEDPILVDLVDEVIISNPAIAEAQARIREARAVIGVVSSQSKLQLNAVSSVGRERLSLNGPGPQGTIPNFDLEQSFLSLGGVAAWEPDIWSKTELNVAASEARAEAAEALERAVKVSLRAETARIYIRLRAAEADQNLIESEIATLEETKRLTQLLVDAGTIADFDLLQIEARLKSLEVERVQITQQIKLLRYGLATLLGRAPSNLPAGVVATGLIPKYEKGIPAGLPSDLLYQRPDVIAARLSLIATATEQDAVSLNGLPTFSLTGDGGLLATGLNVLIDGDARRGLVSAAFNWPILSGGRLSAEREIADARTAAAQASYDQTLLQSLNDVETAFERYASAGETLLKIDQLAGIQSKVKTLAEMRYREGADSQFRALEAQSVLLAIERQDAVIQAARSIAAVDIFTALGGAL